MSSRVTNLPAVLKARADEEIIEPLDHDGLHGWIPNGVFPGTFTLTART